MDLTTIIGVVVGAVLILTAMLLGGSFMAYIDPISMIIVLGGTVAALLTSNPMSQLGMLPKVMKKTISKPTTSPAELLSQMVPMRSSSPPMAKSGSLNMSLRSRRANSATLPKCADIIKHHQTLTSHAKPFVRA